MYVKLPESNGNVLGYHVAGTIRQEEMKEIHSEIENALRAHGKVRLLVEVGDISMPEMRAMIEDLKLTPEYVKDVERFALVGEGMWQEWMSALTNMIARGEARHFDMVEREHAWQWVREGTSPS